MNENKKQILLTQFKEDGGVEHSKIRLNAIEIELNNILKFYISEIQGDFTNEKIHVSHIIRSVNLKYDTALARFPDDTDIDTKISLISMEPLQSKYFSEAGIKFKLIPTTRQVEIKTNDIKYVESLREFIYNYVQQQFVKFGYLKSGSVRTTSGRHSKGYMLKADIPAQSVKEGTFWYHGYDGFNIRVKNWKTNRMLIALDTTMPILKTPHDKSVDFQIMVDNNAIWPSTEDLPESVSAAFISLRKKKAKTRLEQDLILLNQLSFSPLIGRKIGEFEPIKYQYFDEPTLLFGSGQEKQISKDSELSEFIAPSLMKYGPYNKIETPIRVQPVIMKQIQEEYSTERIEQALRGLQEVYLQLYKQDLIINEPIILKEFEDQVENQCQILSKRWKKEFDLVFAFLKGVKFNHPYRTAIKRGLQKVPSQIVKYKNLNAPKIFKDIMSHSILSQINYKVTGKLMSPIKPEDINGFQVRIYYDLGQFRLKNSSTPMGTKSIALVGTAALITGSGIYNFQTASEINDNNKIEIPSRDMVRKIISEVIKKYLKATNRDIVDGNILIQRDGKAHPDEYDEAKDVIEMFRESPNRLISPSCNWVFVEFIKQPVIRLFSHYADLEPRRGTYFQIDEDDSYLTTTGYPDIHAKENKKKSEDEAVGVAVSLEIRRLEQGGPNQISMFKIAKDVYYRSFLWMASFQKSRFIAEANMVHELFDLRRQGVNDPPDWIC